jgi:hypothetical protein
MLYKSLTQKVVSCIIGLCLLVIAAGAVGIMADTLELDVTPSVSACSPGSGAGGDC